MQIKFPFMSIKKIDTMLELEKIRKLCIDCTVEKIQEEISKLLLNAHYNHYTFKKFTFQGFYRARFHSIPEGENSKYIFMDENEYWHPPNGTKIGMGRCNDENQSLLYACLDFETPIIETFRDDKKYFTVAQFTPIISNGQIPYFSIKPVCISYLKKIKSISKNLDSIDSSQRKEQLLNMDEILDILFTEKVNHNETYKYKATNAITRCMLTNNMNQYRKEQAIDGMIYPSIANNNQSLNILFKPAVASNHFRIISLQTFEVIDYDKNEIKIQLIRQAVRESYKIKTDTNSYIIWEYLKNGEIHSINLNKKGF